MRTTPFKVFFCAFALVMIPLALPAQAADGNQTISVSMFGSTLILQTSDRMAGAISALNWKGQAFIDSKDHGRELQSDVFFDNDGVCYNPTEAGSRTDGAGHQSSSRLLALRVRGNQLWSTTQLAFWLQPGQSAAPQFCGNHPDLHRAVNKAILSKVVLRKRVTVGLPDFPNVIRESITFDVPAPYKKTALSKC